jgi:exosome complex component RRP46
MAGRLTTSCVRCPSRSLSCREQTAQQSLLLVSFLFSRSARFRLQVYLISLSVPKTGPTAALASVTGPTEVRLRDELVDRATLEINFLPLRGLPGKYRTVLMQAVFFFELVTNTGQTGPSSKSLASSLHLALSPLVLLHNHPRSLIQLTIQTVANPTTRFSRPFKSFASTEGETGQDAPAWEDDSAVEKAAALNAATAALMDAGVAMKGVAFAVAVAVLNPTTTTAPDEEDSEMQVDGARVVVDPSPEEERDAKATIVAAFSFGKETGGDQGESIWIDTSGDLEQAMVRGNFIYISLLRYILASNDMGNSFSTV